MRFTCLVLMIAVTARWTTSMVEASPRVTSVPATQEIEILDPSAHPLGQPGIDLKRGLPGHLEVDIPRTVLVHRYYFTGDRKFQAQLLPGGPSIVVAHHPKTGQLLHIPVQLVPGAPKVTYTGHSIEYDFGFQVTTIHFHHNDSKAHVSYSHGQPIGRNIAMKSQETVEKTKALWKRTGIPRAADLVREKSKDTALTALDRSRELARTLVQPAIRLTDFIPGINTLKSDAETRAMSERDRALRTAKDRASKIELPDISTVR